MGRRNVLIDGISGTGKTTVCDELLRRGHQAIHGDRELAYRGDPETGRPNASSAYEHHIWDVEKVRTMAASRAAPVTFFCGGSRNSARFIDLFDAVFVLEADLDTINRRIDERLLVDPTDWGGEPEDRVLLRRIHRTKAGISTGTIIDATQPLAQVVEEILSRAHIDGP